MASFTPWRRMLCHLCHVHETSPGTHTLFPTYTCPVYCWRSVQLLDFGLSCNLIHASQPVRTTFTGQWFASGFLQTPPHGDALAIGCTLPTAGRVRDFHPLERAPAGHTRKTPADITPAGYPYKRRRRDLNPCAGATDLLVFEARPFSHLGTPPEIVSFKNDL